MRLRFGLLAEAAFPVPVLFAGSARVFSAVWGWAVWGCSGVFAVRRF